MYLSIVSFTYVFKICCMKSCVPGMGDQKIQDISFLPDPCPLPEQIKKRALIEKEKFIYAPFSGVGGIVYDKDAVYVELGGSHSHNKKDDNETDDIVTNLIETKETLDVKMQHSELQLFSDGKTITARDFEEGSEEEDTENTANVLYEKKTPKEQSDLEAELKTLRNKDFTKLKEQKVQSNGRIRRKVIFEMSDDELEKTLSDSENEERENKEENEYTVLKTDKNEGVHTKIKDILQDLEKRATFEPANLSGSDDDTSDEDNKAVEASDNSDDDENDTDNMGIRWKENLARKAEDAFLERQSSTKNLMKLVYGKYERRHQNEKVNEEQEEQNEKEDIGGLFRIVSHDEQRKKIEKDSLDLIESSLFMPWNADTKNWLDFENKILIQNCFVTGKWKDSEDASKLLKLDDAEDLSNAGSEVYGDFEDLETGEKHEAPKKRKLEETEDDEATKKQLAEKKRKLKEKFDAEYDNTDKSSYYDELKMNAEKQAQLNKSVFENMDDDVRVQIEGYRPGMYVRIEFEKVPAEFVTNFDPTYPLLIGSLNMGEENIGYVNVRIKKHRWYKRILKTNDPLIISLGWRRFQTVPLFSKLEDDLKFRYLKYTPEHISCNAHFWGPITPQGTGFLALQSCESNPEVN